MRHCNATIALLGLLVVRILGLSTPDTFFRVPKESGEGPLYATNQVYELGSVLNVKWVSNEPDYGIWLWQQDTSESSAEVDSESAVLGTSVKADAVLFRSERQNKTSPANTVGPPEPDSVGDTSNGRFPWKVSTGSFSLRKSNVFFLSSGPLASLTGTYATCHYFNISADPVPPTGRPSSSVATPTSSSIASSRPSSAISGKASSSTATVTSSSPADNNSSDSTATKVGLGVGLGVGIPLVLVAIGFLFLKVRKTWQKNKPDAPSPSSSAVVVGQYPADKKVMEPRQGEGEATHELSGADQADPRELEAPGGIPAELSAFSETIERHK
ncbi:MAG: hypothetical protein M1831_001540 [Alyxoria varia]|nr:MAG: hypothetical protein M1831_001540 [Alyxoria varia]